MNLTALLRLTIMSCPSRSEMSSVFSRWWLGYLTSLMWAKLFLLYYLLGWSATMGRRLELLNLLCVRHVVSSPLSGASVGGAIPSLLRHRLTIAFPSGRCLLYVLPSLVGWMW